MDILLLHSDQLTRKILDIFNELSPTKSTALSEAKRIIDSMNKKNQFIYVGYLKGIPIGLATIVYLEKISYGGSYVGLIEDVVITKKYQGKGYGRQLIKFITEKAFHNDCRKIILYCKDSVSHFYEECGFEKVGVLMRMDRKE